VQRLEIERHCFESYDNLSESCRLFPAAAALITGCVTTGDQNMTTSKIALVTGASRGLGRSMALHLADHGVDVILTYKAGAGAAAEVVTAVEARGRKAVALPLDVGTSAGFPAFVDALRDQLARRWQRDRFDFLVNNAGVGAYASIVETTEAQLDELFRVHLKGPFVLTQRLLPLLADGGRILNVSTGLARFTFPGYAAYAAMKGGVEVLTRYLAKELAARGITANTIAPGAIETDFGGGAVRDDRALNEMLASMTALGRVGLPDDIGGAVALLLAPEARWLTGQRIEVAGGMML
jgi:NAD(P)-dependent dehydrogenase (short-subunit alcohol dehydrogenase family)